MSNVSVAKLFLTAEETNKPEVSKIKGEIPSWLKGTYYRVGPSLFDFENFTMNHLLDGYAMVSKFEINSETVTFEKKFLLTDAYKRSQAAQKPVITEFATTAQSDPSKSLLSKMVSALIPEFTDNDYSTLFKIGPDLFSIADTCFFRQIDLTDLGESPEKHDSNKYFGLNSQSAHPLTDENGDLWNIGITLFTGLKYHVIKVPGGKGSSKDMLKRSKSIATIPSRWNGSIGTLHSFGMSQKHIIFIEQPMVASVSKLCSALVKKSAVRDWLEWRGDTEKNRFVVVSKSGKIYKTDYYSSESFYFMHTVNSYDEDNHVIVDIITYASASVLDIFYLENLRENVIKPSDFPQFQRFVIPLIEDIKKVPEDVNLIKLKPSPNSKSTASAIRQGNRIVLTPEIICEDKGMEMPSINHDCMGKKNNFMYAAGTINQNSYRNKIVKVNMETRQMIHFKENDHVFPGEPIFIQNPSGLEEDDGLVLAAMSDTRKEGKEQDFLIFLDKNMQEVARCEFQNDIPSALHGIFLPD